MQFVVKFACAIAIAFLFASCYSDVPELIAPEDVGKYKFCKYKAIDDESDSLEYKYICKSTYEISESDCNSVDGEIFDDKDSCEKAL
ncbi:MAG: hypothetical protein LBC75_10270 [Fibromonadaceae bacterium]|jgi:hypothetical protein|nr:hypothetical protein [Fibromonadaceae bacterium]